MELTEETLRIIADNMTDLRFRLEILKKVVIQGGVAEQFDALVKKALASPKFQERCDEAFAILKGDR
jgi:hypothetical protein